MNEERLFNNKIVHVLIIISLGFLVYSNTFQAPFVFDDVRSILDNQYIKDLRYFKYPFHADVSVDQDNKALATSMSVRYVGYLTFALNYRLHGLNVLGYHIVNLVIHITAALLVYWLVILTFRTPYFTTRTSKLVEQPAIIALLSAVLFVCHPIQTQAVTYVVQRFASLATMFYMLALVLYIKFRLGPGSMVQGQESADSKFKHWIFYLASFFCVVLAMKTKEIAITLPVIITLYEFMFFKEALKKKMLYVIPILLTTLVIPMSMADTSKPVVDIIGSAEEISRENMNISRLSYLFTEFRVMVTYIRLLLLPVAQNLDYDYPVYNSFSEPAVFLSFLFLTAVLGLGIYLVYHSQIIKQGASCKDPVAWGKCHESRLIAFGIFWFFITISVESSIIPITDVIFEHRVYLPSAGFFMALTTSFMIVSDRLRNRLPFSEMAVRPVIIVAVILLSCGTYARNNLWMDGMAIWEDTAKKSPLKARPHYNLATGYYRNGHINEAIREFETVLKKKNHIYAHYNLALCFFNVDRIDESIVEYQRAIMLDPDHYDSHINLGVAFIKKGRIEEAVSEFLTAVKLKPDDPDAYSNLGSTYESMGRMDMAITEYKNAYRLRPDIVNKINNEGVNYFRQDRLGDAVRKYLIAIQLKPDLDRSHYNLGLAYKRQGRLNEAVRELRTAIELKPDLAGAYYNVGIIYREQGMNDKAMREFEAALKFMPEHADARKNLEAIKSSRRRV